MFHWLLYWLLTIIFNFASPWHWLLVAILVVVFNVQQRHPDATFRRLRERVVHRYWLSKVDIGSLSAREREFMAEQAKIWRRYAGMKGVPLNRRQVEFTRESRALLGRHELYKGNVRRAVSDERMNRLRKEMYGE